MMIISTVEDTIDGDNRCNRSNAHVHTEHARNVQAQGKQCDFATYPPLTHARKRAGEAKAREVKNHWAPQMTATMARARR